MLPSRASALERPILRPTEMLGNVDQEVLGPYVAQSPSVLGPPLVPRLVRQDSEAVGSGAMLCHPSWTTGVGRTKASSAVSMLAWTHLQDMKVIVSRMSARVPFRPQRRPKHNQVLRDACVDDVHAPHGAAGVVKDPFVFVRADTGLDRDLIGEWRDRDVCGPVGRAEGADDVVDGAGCAVGVLCECFLEEDFNGLRGEDVEVGLVNCQ